MQLETPTSGVSLEACVSDRSPEKTGGFVGLCVGSALPSGPAQRGTCLGAGKEALGAAVARAELSSALPSPGG